MQLQCFNPSQVGYKLGLQIFIGRAHIVSIPHRQATNSHPTLFQLYLYQVSIPHRQATNECIVYIFYSSIMVSIPHRQATNLLKRDCKTFFSTEFQSLIGRLQTFNPLNIRLTLDQFQSLIGRLQTTQHLAGDSKINEFQSLIGRLQTVVVDDNYVGLDQVSIPHRQATNERGEDFKKEELKVSIPHRQATNPTMVSRCSARNTFQSLIGRLQTHACVISLTQHLGFNPSQVGYKPKPAWLSHFRHFSFNPSQVGYKQTPCLETPCQY